MSNFTISQASTLSGLSPKMIRDYETKGITAARGRNKAGYRIYEQADIEQLRFIARARHLGFSLKQIQAYCRSRIKSPTVIENGSKP